MTEVIKDIYIGNEDDFYNCAKYDDSFNVIHAKSEPYFVQGLSYLSQNPTLLKKLYGHRYLYCRGELCLDFPSPFYYDNKTHLMFDEACEYIKRTLSQNKKILIHCANGFQRSPAVLFYYFLKTGYIKNDNFSTALNKFYVLYPSFTPTRTMLEFFKNEFFKNENLIK